MKIIFSVVLLKFCLFTTHLFAQHYYFRTYGLEDGLPQSQVNCIIQDDKDYLWFGTNGGVCRFDGKIFTVYGLKNGLPDNLVKGIIIDTLNRLWVLTEQGISRFDGKKFIGFTANDGLPNTKLSCMTQDQNGDFWIGTGNMGILKLTFDGNGSLTKIVPLTKASGIAGEKILSILTDSQGKIWAGTDGSGVNIIDIGKSGNPPFKITRLVISDSLPGYNAVYSLFEDRDGNLWIGTQQNMVVFKNNKFKFFELVKNPTLSSGVGTFNIFQDRKGTMWFAVFRGIYSWNGTNMMWYSPKEGIPEPVWSVYEDIEGNIWAGTNSGLVRFSGKRFCNFSTAEGLNNDEIWSIVEDNGNDIWLATHGGISQIKFDSLHFKWRINRNNQKSLSQNTILYNRWYDFVIDNFNALNSSIQNLARAVLIDHAGNLWTGTNSGVEILPIKHFSDNQFNSFTKKVLGNKSVFHLLQDRNKNIWISTYGDGIYIYPYQETFDFNPQLLHYSTENGLCDNVIRCVYEDANGIFWYATNAGCLGKITFTNPASLSQPVFQSFSEKDGLKNARILSITGDMKDNIWLGTYAGLSVYNGKNFRWIAEEEGLSSTTVYFLITDDNGNLWAGTNKGLDKLDLNEYYKTGKTIFRHYGPLDGFTGIECNPNAAYKDHVGNLWFGTVKGVFKYTPQEDKKNTILPQMHITGLRLFFKEFDWSGYSDGTDLQSGLPVDLTLPYDQNHLTFDFTGISLTIPEKVKYQYMLEGLDVEWSPPVTVQSATYSGIPHGKYTFLVKACNNDGIWNSEPATFSFVITPPFWRTWWFIVCTISIIGGGVYFYFWIRIRNLRLAKKILEEKVRIRTAEISRQKEIIEIKNKDIEQKNKNITDSIEYARYLQQAVLPDTNQLKIILPDSFIYFLPKDILSGDFYWFCETGDKIMVAACDCTGHGVGGALLSVLCNNLLFQAVFDHGKTRAGEILSEVNKTVLHALKKKGATIQAEEGMDASLCVIDKQDKYLEFAGAINPLVIVKQNEIMEIPGDIKPVGGSTPPDYIFTTHKITPDDESTFYIFSDGYHSQFGGPKEKKLSKKGFIQTIKNISKYPLDDQTHHLNKSLIEWKNNLEQVDDILVIGFRVNV